MCRAQHELSFHEFFTLWRPPEPENWPIPQVMLFQSLASMLTIVTVVTLNTIVVVSRCSWMWCFMLAWSRSTSHEGKIPQCYIMKNGIGQCRIGFLRHNCAKFYTYNGAVIHMVDVIAPDDADAARKTKFHRFHGWTHAVIIRVTKHCPSWGDKQHSRKKKIKYNYLENKSI